MATRKDRKLTRYYVSQLIENTWVRAASVSTGVAGFRATGIFPYRPESIPDHFFSIFDATEAQSGSAGLERDEVHLDADENREQHASSTAVALNEPRPSRPQRFSPTAALNEPEPAPSTPRKKQKPTELSSSEESEKETLPNFFWKHIRFQSFQKLCHPNLMNFP